MDWYIVIKTINGRRYRYRQKTWREAGRVRTRSEYLGPADGEATGRNRGMLSGEFRLIMDKVLGDGRKGPPRGNTLVGEIRLRLMRLLCVVHRA